MNLKKAGLSFAVMASLSFSLVSCGPKDEDIKKSIEAKLSNVPGVSVEVKDGVATLSGAFIDDATKTAVENDIKAVKGVKSVVDNATVTPPPAPVVISADDQLKATVTEALKEYSGLSAEVKDGIVTLTGEVKKADLVKVMQALNALKPKKIDNKATIK